MNPDAAIVIELAQKLTVAIRAYETELACTVRELADARARIAQLEQTLEDVCCGATLASVTGLETNQLKP